MKIQILGTGCPKCKKLSENTEQAVKETETNAEIEKVTDINEIMNFGVVMIPALAIDGKVISSGKTLSIEEIKKLIK